MTAITASAAAWFPPISTAPCAIARRVRTGTMSVNGGMSIAGDIPFGGYKASGVGREWGREGIEEHLETKLVAWRA